MSTLKHRVDKLEQAVSDSTRHLVFVPLGCDQETAGAEYLKQHSDVSPQQLDFLVQVFQNLTHCLKNLHNTNPGPSRATGGIAMATQDDLFFQDALRRKQAILQQNANTATQDVTQRPEMQQASDAAAMDRAQLSSQTQLTATDMVNQAQADRAAAANATQTNIATLQDQGSTTRAGMQTGAQLDIAGMEDRRRREQIALDTAKAQDSSSRDWAVLSRPEYTKPEYNLTTGLMESAVKRPAILRSGPSAMDTLTGRTPDIFSSPITQQEFPATAYSPTASPLASMPDAQLRVLKGQADRAQVATPTPPPTPPAAPAAPPVNPRANLDMGGGPTVNQRISAALTPPSDSVGMAALRDVGSGLSALGRATGLTTKNWGQGFKSILGGETPEQLRARRAAAAASSVGQ